MDYYVDNKGMSEDDATVKAQNKIDKKIRKQLKKEVLYFIEKRKQMEDDKIIKAMEGEKEKIQEDDSSIDSINVWDQAMEKKAYLFKKLIPEINSIEGYKNSFDNYV